MFKVIFGQPEKKPRPYTSKVNQMLRKSLNLNKGSINIREICKSDLPAQNPFTEFTRCSMSPEKQRIIKFFGSAWTAKGLRENVSKCKAYINYF